MDVQNDAENEEGNTGANFVTGSTEKERARFIKLLEIGYLAAVVIAGFGLVSSALFMFDYLHSLPKPEQINQTIGIYITAQSRFAMFSTAIFVAMTFGFLGFALFLMQVKGEVQLEGAIRDYKLNITRLSPGLFIILCSTVIIMSTILTKIEFYKISGDADSNNKPETSEYDPPYVDPPPIVTPQKDSANLENESNDTSKSERDN